MQNSIFRLAVASLIVIVALGCARNADSIGKEPLIPDSPDGTVFFFAEAVRDDRAEDILKLFPESYIRDINEITMTFAEKMDPAVYDQAFAIVMRAIEVLDDRKDIILGSETFKSTGANADEIREGLSNTQVFTDTLKASEIATLEGLGSADWEHFLATTGNEFLKHAKTMEAEEGGILSTILTPSRSKRSISPVIAPRCGSAPTTTSPRTSKWSGSKAAGSRPKWPTSGLRGLRKQK